MQTLHHGCTHSQHSISTNTVNGCTALRHLRVSNRLQHFRQGMFIIKPAQFGYRQWCLALGMSHSTAT